MAVDNEIRVPNVPMGQLVDENGFPTDDFLTFLQALTQSLQRNFGSEGLVAPSQSATNRTIIQNHQNIQDIPGIPNQYTCQLGTILYVIPDPLDYTQDLVQIAVRDTNDYPDSAPLFKTVTLV